MGNTRKKSKKISQYRKKRRIQIALKFCLLFSLIILIFVIGFAIKKTREDKNLRIKNNENHIANMYVEDRPDMQVELLPINEYSRPGIAIDKVNGIVVHYTANPATTAKQNHDYFEGLATSHKTSASSHFIIGLEGEIIQCIPCNEIAYASNDRNSDTLAIECCIPDDSGKFNQATYDSLVSLTSWLMGQYSLTTDDVIRHYDVTGKNCPKYFVENEDAWLNFKDNLIDYIETYGIEKDR